MGDLDKEVKQIEVIKPIVVKPKKRVKRVVKYKMLKDVGTKKDGSIRYKAGQDYELTKQQIVNFKKYNLICQI